MITLRSFPDSLSASIAQGVLREHGIPSHLANENNSAYSDSRILIPVRLQVSEDWADEARQLIDSINLSLPDDFDPTKPED